MTKPDHAEALNTTKTDMRYYSEEIENLCACYIDLTQQLAELRKAARDSLDATRRCDGSSTKQSDKANAALRKLLEGWE